MVLRNFELHARYDDDDSIIYELRIGTFPETLRELLA